MLYLFIFKLLLFYFLFINISINENNSINTVDKMKNNKYLVFNILLNSVVRNICLDEKTVKKLIKCYEKGIGTQKDIHKALKWKYFLKNINI